MSRDGKSLQAGDTVIIRQISDTEVGITVREIGVGILRAAPEVGSRLRIELRRGRGLASSSVTRLEEMDAGQLAVKTEGRVYVLSAIEGASELDPGAVEQLVRALRAGVTGPAQRSANETEYVRLLPAEPREERRIRVMRLREGELELFGEGELLGEVEVGMSLRFTGQNGHVMGTSHVVMVRELSPSCLEVSTANSRYRVEFLSGRLPG